MARNKCILLFLYLCLGVVIELPGLAIKLWFMRHYGLSIANVGVVTSTISLPWILKPVYGAISDKFPIGGRRRKPYIILTSLLAALLWLVLATFDVTASEVIIFLFFISMLTCFADVLYDLSTEW